MKVLITGITSPLARLVTHRLVQLGHEVVGIDRRPWPEAPAGVQVFQADIRKRSAEDVFRLQRPDALIHMATVTWLTARSEERYRINLMGTRALFDYCASYGVKQAIFIGRHTVYGAAPDAPLYRTEAEPPLAATTFPNLADLVAADLFAGSILWRYPETTVAVLRIVYMLGGSKRGTLANYLRGPRVPTVMGFDPLFQFMHEADGAEAIVTALQTRARGVFNVAGPPPVPLSLLCKETGRTSVPIPEPAFPYVLGRFGFPRMPAGAVQHVKYPIVIDDALFRETTGFTPTYDEVQVMQAFRSQSP
ncbi:MAG: NAD-dependent epimerase/dehydratase family protein [Bradymonadia bacterium]